MEDITISPKIRTGMSFKTVAPTRARSSGRGSISASAPRTLQADKAAVNLAESSFAATADIPAKMAHYGDRLQLLTLEKPIKAAGKVALRRGVSDSGVLIGFFNSRESTLSNPAQDSGLPKGFFGISTDGPSSEGFYFSPTYRIGPDLRGDAGHAHPPRIYPDGKAHDWTFDYSPSAADGQGQITVTLDDQAVKLPLAPGHKASGARFDRFGIVTTWVDGNSQTIYFDDLTYTFRQD